MGKPLQLVQWTGREFAVGEDAVEFLRTLEGPLVVVAVGGPYRSGKSFLVNRLSGSRFGVGSTTNACTKGIWVWGEPKPLPDRPGRVLYLDTEGLGSTDRSSTEDSRIFALGLLLSSFFLYNSRGAIDTSSLRQLSFVGKLTEHLRLSAAGGETEAVTKFLPQFLWVLRDFTVQLKSGGRNLSPKEYLERSLSVGDESSKPTRAMIRRIFPERDCLDMAMPARSADDVGQLDALGDDRLSDVFLRKVSLLRRLIDRAPHKAMDGVELDGSMLADLAETYVTLVNSDETPAIGDAWQRVVRNNNEEALAAALARYRERLAAAARQRAQSARAEACDQLARRFAAAGREWRVSQLPEEWAATEEDLRGAHTAALGEAAAAFRRAAIQDDAALAAGAEALRERAEGALRDAAAENATLSRDACTAVLRALAALTEADDAATAAGAGEGGAGGPVEGSAPTSAAADATALDRLRSRWDIASDAYAELTRGSPAAWEVLATAGRAADRERVRAAAQRAEHAWGELRRRAEEALREAREALAAARAERDAAAARAEAERRAAAETREAAFEAHASHVASLERELERRERDAAAAQAQMARQSEEHSGTRDRLGRELDAAREEKEAAAARAEAAERAARDEREAADREAARARSAAEADASSWRRRAEAAEARVAELAAKQAAAITGMNEQIAALRATFKEQVAAVRRGREEEVERERRAREAVESSIRAMVQRSGQGGGAVDGTDGALGALRSEILAALAENRQAVERTAHMMQAGGGAIGGGADDGGAKRASWRSGLRRMGGGGGGGGSAAAGSAEQQLKRAEAMIKQMQHTIHQRNADVQMAKAKAEEAVEGAGEARARAEAAARRAETGMRVARAMKALLDADGRLEVVRFDDEEDRRFLSEL